MSVPTDEERDARKAVALLQGKVLVHCLDYAIDGTTPDDVVTRCLWCGVKLTVGQIREGGEGWFYRSYRGYEDHALQLRCVT